MDINDKVVRVLDILIHHPSHVERHHEGRGSHNFSLEEVNAILVTPTGDRFEITPDIWQRYGMQAGAGRASDLRLNREQLCHLLRDTEGMYQRTHGISILGLVIGVQRTSPLRITGSRGREPVHASSKRQRTPRGRDEGHEAFSEREAWRTQAGEVASLQEAERLQAEEETQFAQNTASRFTAQRLGVEEQAGFGRNEASLLEARRLADVEQSHRLGAMRDQQLARHLQSADGPVGSRQGPPIDSYDELYDQHHLSRDSDISLAMRLEDEERQMESDRAIAQMIGSQVEDRKSTRLNSSH